MMEEVRFPASALETIREHARSAYPEECCGALFGRESDGRREVVRAAPAPNVSSEPRRHRYLIGPEAVLAFEDAAAKEDLAVIGYYHSHPDNPPIPSAYDLRHAWPWYTYVIIGVPGGVPGKARAWRLSEENEPRFIEQRLAVTEWEPPA